LIVLAGLALPGCRQESPAVEDPKEDLDLGPLPDFSLMDSESQVVSNKDLEGKFWVASFIFTHCNTVCPQVSGTMARMQEELTGQDDVRLVSISVDPEHDTPSVLKEYAGRYGADPKHWLFLTGDKERVHRLIIKGFLQGLQESRVPDEKTGQTITHSPRLVLVDRRGHIRGLFSGLSVDEKGVAIDDVPKLLSRIRQLRGDNP
jgi:cytochrome oxidase Cu insertion factor (SCO1/SenC/PrrC family)